MIITIREEATSEERAQLMACICRLTGNQRPITTTRMSSGEVVALDSAIVPQEAYTLLTQQRAVAQIHTPSTPYQLASRIFQNDNTSIVIGDGHTCNPVTIGNKDVPVIMSGPCAVESEEQLIATAQAVKKAGAQVLRGGAFKPRTSPYHFQGLGIEGLKLLAEAREETGLPIVTEVMEPGMVETIAQYADVLQIGTRNAQNFPLLMAAGRNSYQRPVLLKRGLSSTIEEWLLAAEYIIAAGNPNVILCERGIRSYDPMTRNLLDLSCVPLLHQLTHLPIVVDPSHATGRRDLIITMSRAAIAAEADGLIIETHLNPDKALCDGKQSITPRQLARIVHEAQLIRSLLKEEVESVA